MDYISTVCSGGQSCALLADQNVMGFISAIHELASRERHFYCWLSSVRKLLLTPLRSRGESVSALAPSLFISTSCCGLNNNMFLLNINENDEILYATGYVSVLSPTEGLYPSLGEPCTHLFFSLCERFVRLSALIGRHSASLSYFLHDAQGRDVTSLPLLTHTEHFLDIYKE